jgi:hypothetical protein
MHKIIFILFWTFSLCVQADTSRIEKIEETKLINSNVGKLRFVLKNLENHPYSFDTNRAQVLVSNLNGQLIQTIPLEVSFPQPFFEFIDLNDDGYIDLLVYTSDVGGGSIQLADVFLYIPKLKKFVESQTLSNRGLIIKSDKHACVEVYFDQNVYGVSVEEWCFKIETGRWKMISSKRVTLGP